MMSAEQSLACLQCRSLIHGMSKKREIHELINTVRWSLSAERRAIALQELQGRMDELPVQDQEFVKGCAEGSSSDAASVRD